MPSGRSIRLSSYESTILWILEEAGEEDLSTTVNMVASKHPDEPRELLVDIIDRSLRKLYRAYLVTLEWQETLKSGALIRTEVHDIHDLSPVRDFLHWDELGKYWTWHDQNANAKRLYVCLTKNGEMALER